MAANDYYFDEKVKCECGHHIHARKDDEETWKLCKCGDIDHAMECPVQKALDK